MQSFRFHPAIARWFERTFGSPTEPQVRGWSAIQSGRHVLISAPTGSGKTLAAFLASLDALLRETERREIEVRAEVRTGDTSAAQRQALVKKPPHILVTTPESLYLLLTSESGRRILRTVRTLILDEIHAVVDDRRGAHLALSVERLAALTKSASGELQRIGLSATQKPIEEVARFLVGACAVDNADNPDCEI